MRSTNFEGKYCTIDLKTCIARLAVPTIVKGGMYRMLVEKAGGTAFPRCKVLKCGASNWAVQFDNGKEVEIPKSHLLEMPPGTTFI